MRINKEMQIFINTKFNNRLCKGDIIKGRIIDVSGDIVSIDLGNGDIIKASTLISLEEYKNKILNFLIKDFTDGNIVLTPLEKECSYIKNKETFIKMLLERNNLNADQENIEIIKSLIKFKMPLNKETIEKVMKILNKVRNLINTKENEEIKYLGNNKDMMSDDILKFLKETTETKKVSDDKNVSKNNIITDKIRNELVNILRGRDITPDIIKKVVFLLKLEIQISVNNLKFLDELIGDKSFIQEDLEEFLIDLYEKNIIEDREFKNFKVNLKNLIIRFDGKDKETLKTYYKNLKQLFKELELILHKKDKASDEIFDKFQTLKDKITFLSKLNENATFVYYPFYFADKSELIKKFYVLDKRRFKGKTENLNIMISLETNRFDKIKILANIIRDSITINFYMNKSSYIKIFEKSEYKLKNALIEHGYNKVIINYINGESIDPLDVLSDKDVKNYLLDIRV
ncbi:hypothetical protein [Caloranaerobacter azorensis]|uniref:Flagellar hook-length control protein FliK n=1 Tax=Caloranaerobacter azorensis TaxID=116090 RepID=A0A6P1YBE0_9FIRM|nr:hypothetical protein [Caloranaerobacter azorensis]QIB26212.1 hypothetical protein G3A45_02135 [Caloranaerobacter azorensis]